MAPDNMEIDENSKFKDGVNRNARLIVRNISFKATEGALKEHFSQYGTIEEVKLLKKPDGRLVGCGFVHYTHVPMANKAIAATNKKPFMERPIYVSWAVPKHKYAGQEETETPRKRFNSGSQDDNKPTIKSDDSDDVKPTTEEKNKQRINRNARLVIRNVSFKATEESLKEHFEPYGSILEVKLLKKPDGKLVGCAFVHFKNVPMAKKALLSTNMKPFLGRPISVDWAVAKNKYMQHIVNQQLDMQEDVKKEESDSDDDNEKPINVSGDDLNKEIKSESDDAENSDESGDDEDSEKESEDEDGDDDDDGEEKELEDDNQSQTYDRQRIKLNDAEDGCTVFITNIPFSVDGDQLKDFAQQTAPVKYALICIDKMTEHSKGSGFVKFLNKDDADKFLALTPEELRLEGQTMQVKPALKRETLQRTQDGKKQPKDNRNLYLVKEGVVVAGTKAAVGVSASDMSKRLALERSKTQMLKNLNRFVSRYRLVVSNLPPTCDDGRLRRVCSDAAGRSATITEARVMRDLRATAGKDGKLPSKGYGFVMFMKHEDALTCLRKLNNNPDIFDKNNRPIVSFSIEDRTALNARKKRLEKSIANNPQAKNENLDKDNKRKNRKRKLQQPDESYVKKQKFDTQNDKKNSQFDKKPNDVYIQRRLERKQLKQNTPGQFDKRPMENDYSGLTAKEGGQHKMRASFKLKAQADLHRQNVKSEKKNSKRAMKLKRAMKERVKQPKQKINKQPGKKKRKKAPHHKTGTL